jgi:hypothetical protein
MTDKSNEKLPELADNALLQQPGPGRGPGRPFQKGQSGNPAGRPLGSNNKLKAALQELVEQHLEPLLGTALQLALDGNLQAIKLLFSQIPQEREHIEIALPKISSMADILEANNILFAAISAGQLSPEQGKMISELLTMQMKAIESIDLERRVAQLEARYAEADTLKRRK